MKLRNTTGLNYNTSNLRVCVDSLAGGRIAGRVFSMRLSKPIDFSDVSDFILKVERVLDAQNYPQAFQRKRVFGSEKDKASPYVSEDKWLDEETVSAASGGQFTFTLQIFTRMNTTWQGQVDWLDGGKAQRFQSALQFIELMDRRINGEGEGEA